MVFFGRLRFLFTALHCYLCATLRHALLISISLFAASPNIKHFHFSGFASPYFHTKEDTREMYPQCRASRLLSVTISPVLYILNPTGKEWNVQLSFMLFLQPRFPQMHPLSGWLPQCCAFPPRTEVSILKQIKTKKSIKLSGSERGRQRASVSMSVCLHYK